MADITFYHSVDINEFDPTKNGGDIDTNNPIQNATLNNLLWALRPRMAETGGERYIKFFAKASVDIITLGFGIAETTTSPTEEVYIFKAGSNTEHESDLDKSNLRLYGGFKVNSYDATNKKVTADRDVSNFVKAGDLVTFYDSDYDKIVSWTVDTVSGTDITFTAVSSDDVSNATGASTIYFDSLDSGSYLGFWVKEVVQPFTKPMENPPNEWVLNVWYDLKDDASSTTSSTSTSS